VVLFDEIEKAHPEVFNVLLQIMDEGRLTDSHGRTVDFRNAVVIMTSNLGGQFILDRGPDGDWDAVEEFVQAELRRSFRPEFLNRVDDTILFKPLAESELRAIVELQLKRVERLAGEIGVVLQVSEDAKDLLAQEGYDPAFGARPVKRAIQRRVQDPLALKLLETEIAEGTTIQVTPGQGGSALDFVVLPEGSGGN
jgi:ATP-dependent Clp protease ATP-binding subunit ClpB